MKLSENGRHILKNLEGLRLEAYTCSGGRLTIGYGHTAGVKSGDKCTKEMAESYFNHDVVVFEKAVNQLVKVQLNQNQFDALVIFAFNVGYGKDGLGGSTLLKLLNAGDYISAAGQFERWIYSNKKPCEGLKRRRKTEKELFLKPV